MVMIRNICTAAMLSVQGASTCSNGVIQWQVAHSRVSSASYTFFTEVRLAQCRHVSCCLHKCSRTTACYHGDVCVPQVRVGAACLAAGMVTSSNRNYVTLTVFRSRFPGMITSSPRSVSGAWSSSGPCPRPALSAISGPGNRYSMSHEKLDVRPLPLALCSSPSHP